MNCDSIAERAGAVRKSGQRGLFDVPPDTLRLIRFGGRQRNFTGESFWARGYFVSTAGLDENGARAYIRHQEQEDERYDQMKLKR